MIVAGIVTVIWPFFNTGLDEVVPGLLASIGVLIIVSLMTKHSSEEIIKAVYWEDLPSASRRIVGDDLSEIEKGIK